MERPGFLRGTDLVRKAREFCSVSERWVEAGL